MVNNTAGLLLSNFAFPKEHYRDTSNEEIVCSLKDPLVTCLTRHCYKFTYINHFIKWWMDDETITQKTAVFGRGQKDATVWVHQICML